MSTPMTDSPRTDGARGAYAGPGRPRPQTPSATTALRRAAAYEWHHLRGLHSTWILLAVVAVLSVGNGASLLLVADESAAPSPSAVADALQWSPAATQVSMLALFLITLGTGSVSTDLTRGAARTTWLTAASRGTAFAAKLGVAAVSAAAVAAASALLAGACGALALAVSGAPQPAWGQALPALLRFVLVLACWPVVAGSVAALVRNRAGTVLVLVVWPLIAERLTGLLLGRLLGVDGLGGRLPFAAARAAMSGAPDGTPDDAGAAFAQAMLGSDLAPGTGLLVHVLFTLVLAAAGVWAYRRRDAP
ncbi:hypothetical protein ACFVRB_06610 [Streptomyces nojiriensis]|uniref:hypothetical protein n=1 Tax=Streptomyces nojiriensis TaxID=66374 RepID=UPI0036DB3A33